MHIRGNSCSNHLEPQKANHWPLGVTVTVSKRFYETSSLYTSTPSDDYTMCNVNIVRVKILNVLIQPKKYLKRMKIKDLYI